jgi:hypothetical protein
MVYLLYDAVYLCIMMEFTILFFMLHDVFLIFDKKLD